MNIEKYKYDINFLSFIALNTTGANIYPPQNMYQLISYNQIEKSLTELVENDLFGNKYIWLYFHIPYCNTKCLFCNCGSTVLKNKNQLKKYLDFILYQIKLYSKILKNVEITSLYFGGGTPSILNTKLLDIFLSRIKNSFTLSKDAQWNFEIHPSTITKDKINILKKYNINRVTIWIQSLDDKVLELNNRFWKVKDIYVFFDYLRELNYSPIINVDFMVGIRGQWIDEIKRIYNFIKKYKVDVVHLYPFRSTSDTLFYRLGYRLSEKEIRSRDIMFKTLETLLLKLGYNYIKHDSLALNDNAYNKQEYEKEEYNCSIVAFGYPARGYLFNLLSYFSWWNWKVYWYFFEKGDAARRYVFSHLNSGVDLRFFENTFRRSIYDLFNKELKFIESFWCVDWNKLFFNFPYVWQKLIYRWLFASNEVIKFFIKKYYNSYDYKVDYVWKLKNMVGKYYH